MAGTWRCTYHPLVLGVAYLHLFHHHSPRILGLVRAERWIPALSDGKLQGKEQERTGGPNEALKMGENELITIRNA